MIINNLWEESSEQFNCGLCASDEPFFMPLERTDVVGLRVQVPYQKVTANGGGLPTGASVALSIVDEIGTTTLCNLSTANNGRFLLGVRNDATNKIAQYQIYSPIPLEESFAVFPAFANYYSHYYFDVTDGDWVKIVGNFPECDFIYGTDPLPSFMLELKPGRLVVPVNMIAIAPTLFKNNTPTALNLIYTTATNCTFENYQCFRFKLVVTFATSLEVWTLYTKPFRILRCGESVRITTTYPSGTYDMLGYYHDASFAVNNVNPNNLVLRIPADIEREANRVRKSYNSKCYNYRSEIQQRFRLKSDPVPYWFAHEVENIVAGQNFSVNNVVYIAEDEQIFQNSDVDSSQFQNIDLSLGQCKTERVFVC